MAGVTPGIPVPSWHHGPSTEPITDEGGPPATIGGRERETGSPLSSDEGKPPRGHGPPGIKEGPGRRGG
ncbi:hypothetical protein P170DRAFT_438768 [Aspergillus steynii IBT 23096]|uniref:Uncharacterized protein n=1 Tax=Aspergillus steynii IBT 23096 TaxID=1392250 RepID=A0A2I2G2F6_9EURO|nr:uncharacterized protein P170DRAFT_438768 [Aspergillus steynii IBT 23096]PLB47059.1 hypothetical protein P170DRAFT_438768 [Aspergillus steynii IBT 23096]